MWANPIVQGNVARLKELGYAFVGPEDGWLACRTVGPGRMSDPAEIVEVVVKALQAHPPRVAAGEA
jgi:phosphopantothenoylcysteine decarboxylase/phosphopantothenate--cysteine ligase